MIVLLICEEDKFWATKIIFFKVHLVLHPHGISNCNKKVKFYAYKKI